jgi:hypothetical protein
MMGYGETLAGDTVFTLLILTFLPLKGIFPFTQQVTMGINSDIEPLVEHVAQSTHSNHTLISFFCFFGGA